MKAKFVHILLAGVLLISTLSIPASAADLPFSDVSTSAWYFESVERVYHEDWMNGTSTSTFAPNGPLTRAMLAVILWRIEGCPSAGQSVVFTDTAPNDWFAEGLSWCVESGAFAGFQDGSFPTGFHHPGTACYGVLPLRQTNRDRTNRSNELHNIQKRLCLGGGCLRVGQRTRLIYGRYGGP